MTRLASIVVASVLAFLAVQAQAALIVNAARPITDQINVNLITVADNNGANSTAGVFGTATEQAEAFSFVDVIFAQAGVNVEFAFRPGTYNSTFALTGTPGNNNPRPQADLGTTLSNAATAGGVLSGNVNTINVFLVSIVPGFGQLSDNSAAGLANIAGNGVSYYGGPNLAGFEGGREVLAAVLAHELGHNLGLDHVTIAENLMRSGSTGDGQKLNDAQISTILASPFTVAAPTTLPGDFNNDGRVDGADFLRWQRGGSPNPGSATDLALWRSKWGTSAVAVGQAIPEPSTVVVAIFVGTMLLSRRSPWRARL
jgi:hypothetical protein